MSQLMERMASAGWPMLDEMDGEPVSYGRTGGTGFPKSIRVLFGIDNTARKEYDDGRGVLQVASVHVKVEDVGGVPQIGTDTITREDDSVWTVEEIKSVVGGVAHIEAVQYAHSYKSGRASRIAR